MMESLIKAALLHSPQQRTELADLRWESLPNEVADTAFADQLAQEVRSRREQQLREHSPLHSWAEVRSELYEIIAQYGCVEGK